MKFICNWWVSTQSLSFTSAPDSINSFKFEMEVALKMDNEVFVSSPSSLPTPLLVCGDFFLDIAHQTNIQIFPCFSTQRLRNEMEKNKTKKKKKHL